MRKASTVVGLMLVVASAATARAQDSGAPAAAGAPGRLQLGASFLPMAVGKFIAAPGGMTVTADAAFAFGVGLSASYLVTYGLSVGFAPQAIFNVKPKEDGGAGAREYDAMARVAYTLAVADTIALYAEVLPGYSLIAPPDGDTAKGPVVAFGVGGAMDLNARVYATLGVGYQIGFQKRAEGAMDVDVKTRYVRLALGGGMRF
jgi:hypothetical protein